MVIESHVINSEGMSLQKGMDSAAIKEIEDWQVCERPHLQLKQGESQTPKSMYE